jgi:CubicO group peptidase (beta-lactamase class C family)
MACAGPEEQPPKGLPEIELVERGLLPPTIIDGEAGYSLVDRMRHHGVPGVSIAVIEGSDVSWIRHSGFSSIEDRRSVDDDTIFNVGSVSKAVTAVTILSLARDGLVDLDLPVNDQLRSWKIPDNEFTAQAEVTPIRLMNHSGGVVFSPPSNYPAEQLPTLLQILEGLSPARSAPVRVDRVPGTVFQYSNAGFEILRQLAEDVTGRSFPEIVQERVFDPIGMTRSSIEAPLPDERLAFAAMGHGRDGRPDAAYRRWLPHTAAGGLWTTAADYAAFLIDIQRALAGEPGHVLDQGSAELMVAPHDAPQYGLGVFQRGGGVEARYVSHLGDGPGFVAGFVMEVTGGRGMVVLTNGQGGIELVREIRRGVAAVEAWPDFLPEPVVPLASSLEMRSELEGRYRVGEDEEVVIEDRKNALWLRSLDLSEVKLFFADRATLVCRERAGEIAIRRDEDGSVQGLELALADELGRMPAEAEVMMPMTDGERTTLGLLLDGRTAEAVRQYREILADDPPSPVVAENRFNSLGYSLLGQGRVNDALAVFRLNVILYPESSNAHDSFGEALMKAGMTDEAIARYRRSLELDPGNHNAEQMIAAMGG